jgi:predicted nucleic acid-binding protein
MNDKLNYQLNRRNFLKASAVAVFASTMATSPLMSKVSFAQTPAPLDVLNYALTLEHLESRAYRDIIASGLLSGTALTYFRDFGAHEAAHVTALTDVIRSLNGTPVTEQANYNWPRFANQSEVLTFFHTVEELGAAAYLGQAANLISNDALLTAAVSIHNVEAQHAAALADLIGADPSPDFGTPKTMEEVLAVVTPILTTVPSGMPPTGRGGFSGGFGSGSVRY